MKRGRPKGRSRDNRSFGPLGDLIRKHRLDKKLGLADLAKACDCSVQFISNIEHGRAPLPWKKAQQLSNILKIPTSELQSAYLAVRSDFKIFIESSGKKVKKPAALKNISGIASAVTLVSSDSSLQEVIQRYKDASVGSRKNFVKAALDILSH